MAVKHSTSSDGTFSTSGATAWDANHTVDDNTLVAAKLAAVATSRFFGRITAGAGAGEELTAANAKTILAYTLASSDFVNQGTTTTILHGNAAGNPAFSAVVEADITLADNTTNNVSATAHGFAPKFPNNTTTFLRGDGTYAAPTASASLSGISAATASNTIASGNNTGQIWNWANTTDSTVAFTIGETSAATGGTSTSGIPNQVLLKLATLAASTQSPLSVYSRGSHVFSVSPTNAQILITDGAVGNPALAFASSTGTGFYGGGTPRLAVGGTVKYQFGSSQFLIPAGSATAPGMTDIGIGTDGWSIINTGKTFQAGLGIVKTDLNTNWDALGTMTSFKSSADAVGYAMRYVKSRGTTQAPTVITTADVLTTLSGYGYLGSTNTYKEAARIEFDSTGTIADSTSGIGGIVKIMTTLAGTDTAVQEVARFFGGSSPQMGLSACTFANLGTPANGTFAYCSDCDAPTLVDSTCTSSGGKTGSFAARVNGAWKCFT